MGKKLKDPRSRSMIPIAVALAAICFALSNPGRVHAVPSQMSHEIWDRAANRSPKPDDRSRRCVQAGDVRVEFEGDKVLPGWCADHS